MSTTNHSLRATGISNIASSVTYTATPRVTTESYIGCSLQGTSTMISQGVTTSNHTVTNLPGPTNTYFTGLTLTNSNNMRTKQVKAAVFTIERNDKNEVISSTFKQDLWVEIKNGASLDLAVAKQLKGDFDPETTVVKEIYTVTF